MRTGGRVLEDELEHLDPLTGAELDAEPPPIRRPSIRLPVARWSFGAGLVVVTVLAAHAVVHHRAATAVDRLWASARAERQHLVALALELYQAEQIARMSGPEDHGLVIDARASSATEARRRLVAVEADLRDLTILDRDLDHVRDRLTDRLDRWATELEEYVSGNRIFMDDDVGDGLTAPVADARKRWRVRDPARATSAALPGVAVVERLERPVDAPVGAIVTAMSTSGERIDADLSSGEVTLTRLENPPPLNAGGASDMRLAGGRFTLLYGVVLVALPLDPGPQSDHLGLYYVPPSDTSQTWVVTYEGTTATVSSLDDPTKRHVVPDGWSVAGATGDELVLMQYEDEREDYTEVALLDVETGRRETIDDDGGVVVGVGADTVVWTRHEGTIRVRTGGNTRTIAVPDGWSVGQRIRVADDGTVAVPLHLYGRDAETRTRIAVLRPWADDLTIAAERDGGDVELCWAGDWLFWTVGRSGYQRGITAHHVDTGRTLSVRLPRAVRTFVARAAGE